MLGVGFLLPVIYFLWSLRRGKAAGDNPWGARGLEWETTSPPPVFNFEHPPVVDHEAYDYVEHGPVATTGPVIPGAHREAGE